MGAHILNYTQHLFNQETWDNVTVHVGVGWNVDSDSHKLLMFGCYQ